MIFIIPNSIRFHVKNQRNVNEIKCVRECCLIERDPIAHIAQIDSKYIYIYVSFFSVYYVLHKRWKI